MDEMLLRRLGDAEVRMHAMFDVLGAALAAVVPHLSATTRSALGARLSEIEHEQGVPGWEPVRQDAARRLMELLRLS